eukprot:638911-Prorocentrum_minimum.AAC.4
MWVTTHLWGGPVRGGHQMWVTTHLGGGPVRGGQIGVLLEQPGDDRRDRVTSHKPACRHQPFRNIRGIFSVYYWFLIRSSRSKAVLVMTPSRPPLLVPLYY